MNTEFKRESIVRHQSERLLDRNLISYEREKQPLHEYEKQVQKKIKKDEEEKKVKEEIVAKMKSEDIKPQDALDRIVKLFENPKKCSKAIIVYKDLLTKNFNSLEPDHVFYSFSELMKNFHLMSTGEDKKTIQAIFQIIEANKDKILHCGDFKNIFEIWRYEGEVHPQIFTDDSYQLNAAIKKVKDLMDDLSKSDEQVEEQKIIEVPEVKPTKPEAPKADLSLIRQKLMKKKEEPAEPKSQTQTEPQPEPVQPALPKYEYTIPQECLDNIKGLEARRDWRRRILFEMTKDIYGLYKHPWAKPAVKQYLDQLYFQRDIFNEEQKKGVEDFKAGLSNLKGLDTVKGFRRDNLDSKIMSNPLISSNEIKDARATSFSFDSIGKWAGRQSGM